MTHLERMQAAIIARVFFHKHYAWRDPEQTCNNWMASWDCFRSFRTSQYDEETPLLALYRDWFLFHAWRGELGVTSNIAKLLDNLYLLSALPQDFQLEILKNEYSSDPFPELFKPTDPSSVPQGISA